MIHMLLCTAILFSAATRLRAENPVNRLWFDQTGDGRGCDLSYGKHFKKSIKALKERGKTIDLSGANLEGADFSQADLYGAHFENAQMDHAIFTLADLRHAHLRNCSLVQAHLQHADLESADLENANLEGAYLEHANFKSAYMRYTSLRKSHLRGADFDYAVVSYADFSEAHDLEKAVNLQENDTFINAVVGKSCAAQDKHIYYVMLKPIRLSEETMRYIIIKLTIPAELI